jgi:diguanylate cyclase (GGDEF)-like protein
VQGNQAKVKLEEAAPSLGELHAENRRLTGELTRAQARIAELEARADVDPLLDILNRRGFERELKRALAYLERYSSAAVLMFIDLDGFKAVNDQYGHAVGDALLKVVAAQLAGHVRASDVVGRLGGDEFGVVMWHIDPAQASAKARELESIIEAAGIVRGARRLAVGASAGTVTLDSALEPTALIDAADRAMYARKRERRG